MVKTLATIRSTDYELSKVAEDVKQSLNALASNPFLNGQLLENISLVANQDNLIEHKLDRPLRFWSIVRGPIVSSYQSQANQTDWVSYTPTFTNFSIGNGSLAFFWRRIGDTLEIQGRILFGTTTSLTGTFIFSAPSGFDIDETKEGSSTFFRVGTAQAVDSGSSKEIYAIYQVSSTNTFSMTGVTNAGTSGDWNATFPFTWGNADEMQGISLKVPIVGASYVETPKIVEITSDFPSKYLKLRATANCSVSLFVG